MTSLVIYFTENFTINQTFLTLWWMTILHRADVISFDVINFFDSNNLFPVIYLIICGALIFSFYFRLNALLLFYWLIMKTLLHLIIVLIWKRDLFQLFSLLPIHIEMDVTLFNIGVFKYIKVILCQLCRGFGIIIVCVLNHYINVIILS